MKKRKILAEKNSGHKKSFAHSSVTSLQTASTSNQRRSRSVKSPSVQNSCNSNSSDKLKNNRMIPDEMQSPKTRFSSRNRSKEARSTSSSRLKSFPAEEIKKLNNAPMFSPEPIAALIMQQDPRETGIFYANSSTINNNGHGDANSAQLLLHQQPKTTSTMNQQQVVANHQQICQTNPHSESLLTRRVASPERQMHRPFTSNILKVDRSAINRSPSSPPVIINQPMIKQTPSTQIVPQTQKSSVVNQNCNEPFMLENEYEKQPVGGRNAANHRQMLMQMQQQKQATILQDAGAPLNDQSANSQNVYHTQFHVPFQQNLQQINQQTQHNTHYQQMMPQTLNQVPMSDQQHIHNNSVTCCSHCNQQFPVAQISGQGMTSPQDMTVNQMRLMQHNLPIHQQNLGYPIHFQAPWPQNDRWMQIVNQNQQSSPQDQYYYQIAGSNQHNFGNQDQSNPSHNQANHKFTDQQLTANNQRDGKKTLQFTPEMIRDQELLVSTMRQQGVPEEIMHRQFDALLNEQRRHLAYVAQFHQEADTPKEIKKTRITRKRTEKEEKPEWMVHITPPRISYSDLERMKLQQRASNEQYLMNDKSPEKINKTVTDQQQNYHQPKEEMFNQVITPQQMYYQVNPHQLWKTTTWPYRNDQILCGNNACYSHNYQQNASNNTCHSLSPSFNKYVQYPYNIRYNPYFPYSGPQEVWPKHNLSSSVDNQKTSIDSTNFDEQSKRSMETSSLLKMRMYKEIIRPQKRNNGLQDLDSIQKMLETLKDSTSRKGLEYLANLAKRKPVVRLNGTQDSNEIPEDMQLRPTTEIPAPSQKRISANGLENNRNSNNPPSRILLPKRINESLMAEYPRQRQNMRNCYSMQAEKENGMIATSQQDIISHAQNVHGSIPYEQQNVPITERCHDNNTMIHQYGGGAPSRHYRQMQQYYLNGQNLPSHGGQGDIVCMQRPNAPGATRIDRAGGDTSEKPNTEETTKCVNDVQAMQGTNTYGQPEIHEARTIGGITYLARKSAVNNLVASPDNLIASRHLQAPKIC